MKQFRISLHNEDQLFEAPKSDKRHGTTDCRQISLGNARCF